MKHRYLPRFIQVGLLLVGSMELSHAETQTIPPAPLYVNSQAIEDRLDSITEAEMDLLRNKKILLVLTEAFRQPQPQRVDTGPGDVATKPVSPTTETLSPDHPEYRAIRSILDANGLSERTVAGVAVVEHGRVVGLYLQEAGVVKLTDPIGQLTALRTLHLYGDRNLSLPLLKSVSPALGKCTELEELLLNQNDLQSLPREITALKNIRNLAVGDNFMKNLDPTVTAWIRQNDPKGLADQN